MGLEELARESTPPGEFKSAAAVLPTFNGRNWILLASSEESGPFITSNRPVTNVWKKPTDVPMIYRNSPGLGARNTQVVFTLSKNLALVGEFEGGGKVDQRLAPALLVGGINSRIILFARQVFAPHMGFRFCDRNETLREGTQLTQVLREGAK